MIGVVVGKFNPPHLGHLHLIDIAARQVDQLYVLLCDRADQTLSIDDRYRWLADAVAANVTIAVTPDNIPLTNEAWAERALKVLPQSPDLAFTSESWGPEWAKLMQAQHVMVDLDRTAFPIGATQLRNNLAANFHWLAPAARADLARRVVLIGTESTGKTTMAQDLAERLGTVWVPEHGRWYWEGRRYLNDQSWTSDEFLRIAAAQSRFEDDLARRCMTGVVIADTDALVTAVWHERYLGYPDPELDALASARVPDLYLVCSPDFDWVQDGSRESRDHRQSMHASLLDRARKSGANIDVLTGPHEKRRDHALRRIDSLTHFDALI